MALINKIYDLVYYTGYGQRYISDWKHVPDIVQRLKSEIEELETSYEKWGKDNFKLRCKNEYCYCHQNLDTPSSLGLCCGECIG